MPREKFLARQGLYREKELASIAGLPATLESAYGRQPLPSLPKPILYDTTGSFCEVVKRGDSTYAKITNYAIVVYLAYSAEEEEMLLERQLANPKPMVYGKDFFDACLRSYKAMSGRSDAEIVPDHFLELLFPQAVKYRRKLYEGLAQVIITTEELEEIYDEGALDKFANRFIQLVWDKYRQGQAKG